CESLACGSFISVSDHPKADLRWKPGQSSHGDLCAMPGPERSRPTQQDARASSGHWSASKRGVDLGNIDRIRYDECVRLAGPSHEERTVSWVYEWRREALCQRASGMPQRVIRTELLHLPVDSSCLCRGRC